MPMMNVWSLKQLNTDRYHNKYGGPQFICQSKKSLQNKTCESMY